jgi:hypothetical protein
MYHITQISPINQYERPKSLQDLKIQFGDFNGLDCSAVILVPEIKKPADSIITPICLLE